MDPVGCSSDDREADRVTCNGLQPWDGVLADGSSALSSSQKQGTGKSPDANQVKCAAETGTLRGMMDITCWGKIGINLGKRLTAYASMRNMPKLLEWYSTTMKKVQDCRGDGRVYVWLRVV